MINLQLFILEKLTPFKAYIMVGLPGSGKSTWIKNNLPKNIDIVNQDSIRVELGIMNDIDIKRVGNDEQEKEVSRLNYERIDNLIRNKKDFVIDNTNVKSGRVLHYYNRLKKLGADVKIILIDTDPEICYNRRKKDIPRTIIDNMYVGIQKVKKEFRNNKDFIIVHNDER